MQPGRRTRLRRRSGSWATPDLVHARGPGHSPLERVTGKPLPVDRPRRLRTVRSPGSMRSPWSSPLAARSVYLQSEQGKEVRLGLTGSVDLGPAPAGLVARALWVRPVLVGPAGWVLRVESVLMRPAGWVLRVDPVPVPPARSGPVSGRRVAPPRSREVTPAAQVRVR